MLAPPVAGIGGVRLVLCREGPRNLSGLGHCSEPAGAAVLEGGALFCQAGYENKKAHGALGTFWNITDKQPDCDVGPGPWTASVFGCMWGLTSTPSAGGGPRLYPFHVLRGYTQPQHDKSLAVRSPRAEPRLLLFLSRTEGVCDAYITKRWEISRELPLNKRA